MKQIKFLFFAMMAVGAVACQSSDLDDVTPDAGGSGSTGSTGKVTLTAGTPSHEVVDVDAAGLGSRMGVTGGENTEESLSFTWQNDENEGLDTFTLYSSTGKFLGCFKYVGQDGASVGDFEQYGDDLSEDLVDGATYTAVIPASNAATLDAYYTEVKKATKSQKVSWGEVSAVDGNIQLEATFQYNANGANSLSFEHQSVVIKLNLTTEDSFVPNKIKVINSVDSTEYDVEIDGGTGSSLFIAIEEGSTALQFDLYDGTTLKQVIGYSITDKMSSATLEAGNWYDCVRTSYYDYYRSGVEIDGETYSSENCDVKLVTGNIYDSAYSNKVVFLDPSSETTTYSLTSTSNIALIGRYSNNKPTVAATSSVLIKTGTDNRYKNLNLSFEGLGYLFGGDSSAVVESLTVEDCNIAVPSEKPIVYLASGKAIKNISFNSNKINVIGVKELLALSSGDGSNVNNISLYNNIVYNTTGTDLKSAVLSMPTAENESRVIDIENNTFYSYLGMYNGNGFIYGNLGILTIRNNIFYSVKDTGAYEASGLISGATTTTTTSKAIGDNKYYSETGNEVFYDYAYVSGVSRVIYDNEASSPLEVTETEGVYTFTSLVVGYGSTIE